MNIGKRLKRYRESLNWDQQRMAEKLGLKNQQAYSYYETKEDIKTSTIKKWNEILGIDILSEQYKKWDDDDTDTAEITELHEPAASYTPETNLRVVSKKVDGQDITMETIYNLSESNKIIALSTDKVASGLVEVSKTNSELAKTNAEMWQMIKATNSSAGSKNLVQDPAFVEFVHVMAKIAVGQTWKSEDEFLAQVMGKLKVVHANADT